MPKRIIGPPSGELAFVRGNCEKMVQPRFMTIFPSLWDKALWYDIDPVGVVAQSIKETGGGAFGGNVKFEFFNPCGLKIRYPGILPEADGDKPLAHQMFPNWDVGAMAQVQHLRAYAGWPVDGLIVDPRYSYVLDKHKLETWSQLGGKWAPSPNYGIEIENLMERLLGYGG
jgi:N-acetylmuramoyl-L-alanine amidase